LKKYKKKPPSTIEAIQWTGKNFKDIKKEYPALLFSADIVILRPDTEAIHVTVGQYIIRRGSSEIIEVMDAEEFQGRYVAD
jgi:hypothetical protein